MSSSDNEFWLLHPHIWTPSGLFIPQHGTRTTVMVVSAVAWCCIAEESHTTSVAIIQQMDLERLSHKPWAKPVPAFLKEVNKRVAARRTAEA